MPTIVPAFFAYPSQPDLVAETIEQAIANLRTKSGVTAVQSWRESDIAGHFVADQVLTKISERSAFIADITKLNFNVTYEVGFALAKEKKVILTRHKGISAPPPLVADVGIFDTLGYLEYQNAEELETILRRVTDSTPSLRNIYPLNQNVPKWVSA
jgi:hypothetical protein